MDETMKDLLEGGIMPKTLIGGIFEDHVDREMETLLSIFDKKGLSPLSACRGHHPLFSRFGLRSLGEIPGRAFPEPFLLGWPPFVCFSGHEMKVREFYRRVRDAMADERIRGDWRMLEILDPAWEGKKWVMFDAGVYRSFWKFSLRKNLLRKNLRTMESLLEGLDDIVPEGGGKEIESVQNDPGPILGGGPRPVYSRTTERMRKE